MGTVALEQLAVSLELDHRGTCNVFGGQLYLQLNRGDYDQMSVMELPASLEEWRAEHRTARKRADRAERFGYRFVRVRRHERAREIFLINTSAAVRQGRPMSAGYQTYPSETPDPHYPCPRHGIHPYGVESRDGVLVAYLWIYRAGELALVSQILGHGVLLEQDAPIMFLLWQEMLAAELLEPGFVVYNRHDSGQDGLRWWKERVGLGEMPVRWAP